MVTLQCPVCGYGKCYQKRGFCRCGAYLISMDALMGRKKSLPITHPDESWLLIDGQWIRWHDWRAAQSVID